MIPANKKFLILWEDASLFHNVLPVYVHHKWTKRGFLSTYILGIKQITGFINTWRDTISLGPVYNTDLSLLEWWASLGGLPVRCHNLLVLFMVGGDLGEGFRIQVHYSDGESVQVTLSILQTLASSLLIVPENNQYCTMAALFTDTVKHTTNTAIERSDI